MEIQKPILPIGNLSNIVNNETLKWVFVGGKGGVGKTSVSTSLAVLMSQKKQKVLIISTDPAHNLSDAFNQKIGSQPTLINGFTNLYGIELNVKEIKDDEPDLLHDLFGLPQDDETQNLIEDIKNSIPGVDEALAISLLFQDIDKMDYNFIIFDTAPTGHTLRMLSFPQNLEDAFGKLNTLKEKIGPLAGLMASTLGEGYKNLMDMISVFKEQITKVRNNFSNKQHTTFIAVCIPEFLSMYETERLLQELKKSNIDCHNIVINQVLFINKDNDNCDCDMCKSRFKMQSKYIRQIQELYGEEQNDIDEDINMNENNEGNNQDNNTKFLISILPLQEEEIRGIDLLNKFSKLLI